MANEIQFYLGTFALDSTNGISISDLSFQIAKTIQTFEILKDHQSVIPVAKRKDMAIRLRGQLVSSNYDALRTALDSLKYALESSSEQKFTTDDDRYIMAQYRNFGYSYKTMRTFIDFSFDLVASYPFWLAASQTSSNLVWTTATPFNVTYSNGNHPARLKITVTAPGGTPIVDDLKIENVTTGEVFMYRGTIAAGQSLIVNNRLDSVDMAVTNNGTSDWPNFYGDLLTLNPGVNSIKITSAISTATVNFAYRETYK